MYSDATQVVTESIVIANALAPKTHTPTITDGKSAMITSAMTVAVVSLERICGDIETLS